MSHRQMTEKTQPWSTHTIETPTCYGGSKCLDVDTSECTPDKCDTCTDEVDCRWGDPLMTEDDVRKTSYEEQMVSFSFRASLFLSFLVYMLMTWVKKNDRTRMDKEDCVLNTTIYCLVLTWAVVASIRQLILLFKKKTHFTANEIRSMEKCKNVSNDEKNKVASEIIGGTEPENLHWQTEDCIGTEFDVYWALEWYYTTGLYLCTAAILICIVYFSIRQKWKE